MGLHKDHVPIWKRPDYRASFLGPSKPTKTRTLDTTTLNEKRTRNHELIEIESLEICWGGKIISVLEFISTDEKGLYEKLFKKIRPVGRLESGIEPEFRTAPDKHANNWPIEKKTRYKYNTMKDFSREKFYAFEKKCLKHILFLTFEQLFFCVTVTNRGFFIFLFSTKYIFRHQYYKGPV